MRHFIIIIALSLGLGMSANAASRQNDPPVETQRLVAITFDDLPYVHGSGEADDSDNVDSQHPTNAKPYQRMVQEEQLRLISTLRKEQIPATGFVNEDKVEALGATGSLLLAEWNQGLLELANHGFSHFDSNELDLSKVEEQVLKGEKTIRPMAEAAGRKISYFRFPYNHLGNTQERRVDFEKMLAQHGYKIAASTIDTSDYLFNEAYVRALAEGDQTMAERIERAYLDHTKTQITYYREFNVKLFGHEVPDIMLLHANRINAATMERILALFRAQNYCFVSLAEAQAHPAYAKMPAIASKYGPMWSYRWAWERKVKFNGRLEKEPPAWLGDYANRAINWGPIYITSQK